VRRFVLLTISLLVALLASSCDDNPVTPESASIPFSYTDIRVGTGTEARSGSRVTVNYTGWLYSSLAAQNKGSQFDTSVGKTPYTFTIGAGEVIKGWEQGVVGMKVGGLRRIVVPPDLGYGMQALGAVPANATLVFEVELLDVR
jgi:FKBP-type peptidyl-prolyl cis-trans isomerase FkpA